MPSYGNGSPEAPGRTRHRTITSIGLPGHTCRAVFNEVRRVLIVLSKLVVNGAFPPVPDYCRSYEKQDEGPCRESDQASHNVHSLHRAPCQLVLSPYSFA